MPPGKVNHLILPGLHFSESERLRHPIHEASVLHEFFILRIRKISAAGIQRGQASLRARKVDLESRLDQGVPPVKD